MSQLYVGGRNSIFAFSPRSCYGGKPKLHFFTRRADMSSPASTIMVVAGLIQQGGKLLICQRRRDGAFALKWEFPGGKVEPGETYEHGLHRELREELGIEAHIGPEAYRTRHDYPGNYSVE